MQIIDRGTGTPLVIIPGIQGRWEWLTPTVDALSRHCRVITFSLCDEPSSGFTTDPQRGLGNFVEQVERVLDERGVRDAVLMGISYAGPIATEFAVRAPDRVRALMLVSALPPDWEPDGRARFYLRAPRLLSPLFFLDAPLRSHREIRAALPRFSQRARFSIGQVRRLRQCALSPSRMAMRLRWLNQFEFSDASQFAKPVMVITGEAGLDRVVSPALTCRYLSTLPHARHTVMRGTGHLGALTQPAQFAWVVRGFLEEIAPRDQQ